MRIISYSDLHLEFGTDFMPPAKSDADIMILAGDIITFRNYEPLDRFLSGWSKPVLFVAGNHEYYTDTPMFDEARRFKSWLSEQHPNVTLLQDEAVTLNGVHFFGGTMWTDFAGASQRAMIEAHKGMNDYRKIMRSKTSGLIPHDTVKMHKKFVEKIRQWFDKELAGSRVVITHHAPVVNPATQYGKSSLMPAFNSLDMVALIDEYQPDLWVYGHTHECDNHFRNKTRIISNQLGYPNRHGGFECKGFDPEGWPVTI